MTGTLVGSFKPECFEDRMRRITDSLLDEGALATVNCRINGGCAPWFALRVWTGREKTVENTLDVMGIRSLVPMRKGPDLRRRHRVIEGSMMPVIHGYVLVQMMPKAEYLAGLQGVEHAIDVLGGCERPMRISDKEVSRFNAMASNGAYDAEKVVGLILGAGERVEITDGPFFGLTASVVTPNRKGRGDVVVTIRLMGGDVPVTVPLAMLRKL
ncbi:antitermination protein NusG [Neorhizobium sp. T786]|uniref:transcription termination/antitermination protein NusG n=1 Tax=Pseudorhizobium xiangyangii TaxID=2883104 RepID=UPI001CFFC518|nr:transcription termination/antitermination NusG family protein [Neorhizobium xiangyangii]MCB5201900.1 antitermination protein NusG [Neorhizobium xiangyangii]